MLEFIPQALIYVVTIGIVIYIINKAISENDKNCQKIEPSDHPLHINYTPKEKTTPKAKKENNTAKPMLLKEAREGGKDNLQLIKGVGKVLEKTLNDMGVYHFDQIANWTEEEANWIDKSIAFPGRIQREKWVEQAKILASGETTEFAQRVKRGEVATKKS